MTACTNNGGSRARRAVTAALVGVLSVGAAPMVALATEAAPVAGDVQLQATTNEAFNDADIFYSNGEDGASFVYDEDDHFQGLEPESFVYAGTTKKNEVPFTYAKTPGSSSEGYHYFYVKVDQSLTSTGVDFDNGNGEKIVYATEDGDVTLRGGKVSDGDDMKPGTYAVVSFYDNGAGSYICATHADTFTVVNGGLEGATLVDDGDVSDSTFEFTGENGSAQANQVLARLGVAVDGVELTKNTDYTIDSFHEKGKNEELKTSTGLLKVGTTYVVEITGSDKGYDGVKASLEFTFGQLELNKVSVVSLGADTSVPSTSSVKNVVKELNGVANNLLNDSRFSVSVSGPDANGVYTYTIGQSESDKKGDNFVTGTATVTVAVGQQDAKITYDGAVWQNAYAYDMTDPSEKPFDVAKIAAKTDDGEDVAFTHTVQNAKTGAAATDADLATRGEWIVTVIANGVVDGQRWVKCETVTVTNENELTDAANVFVSYDGELVPSGQDIKGTYDGTDLLDKLSVTVKAGDETLVEGTDYTVEVTTKDQTGKTVKVDEVVDAGDYTVTIKGATFGLDTNTYDFKVAQRTLKAAAPADAFAVEGTTYYYNHTGEVIAPAYTFTGDNGKTYEVPADEFEVTYDKIGDGLAAGVDLKDEAKYKVTGIALDSKNFTGAPTFGGDIVVTETGSFVDVPNDAWYAEEVATAKQQGYIGGVGGTNFFAPMNNISRADVACVLYRMAGGKIGTVEEGMTNEELTYISSFEDVDPNAYYAKAIAWTTKMGVTNGYGTTFGISRDITTEEFATMLARYAKVTGTDTSVDADAVLAKVADGDKVTGYARESVAWAVEQGILAKDGNLIDPQGTIYRARVVKIAVDFQPEQLDTILGTGETASGIR